MTTSNPQDSVGNECVFDLQELEFHICNLVDWRNREEDTGSITEERRTSHVPQHQTPDAPPSPGPLMIPDNFPMYEEWGKPDTSRGIIHYFL